MKQKWLRILGGIHCAKPGTVDFYVNDNMGIFIPKEMMDITQVEHIHQGYEFVIPLKESFPYKVDNKILATEPRKIFPLNAKQPHQAVDNNISNEIVTIFFEAEFLQGLAESIYGVKRVNFVNSSFSYDDYLKSLLSAFTEEFNQKQGGYDFITQSIATQVGVYLLRMVENNCLAPREAKRYSNKKGINQAIEFIQKTTAETFPLKKSHRLLI